MKTLGSLVLQRGIFFCTSILSNKPLVLNAKSSYSLLCFQAAYDGMREFYSQQKQPFTELQFCFHYDIASFLAYYSKRLSLAGLERITGVSQAQLSHYMNGYRHPSAKTIRKIESALHAFAKDLQQVRLI